MIKKIFERTALYALYSLYRTGPLKKYGWFNSFIENQAIDGDNNPIPWITYSCFEFIKKRIKPHFTIFEFGCGNSTLWFSRNLSSVISVENNLDWFKKIKAKSEANVNLIFESDNELFYKIPDKLGIHYDILFIDGFDRIRSVMSGIKYLKSDGIIIFDNTDRIKYKAAFDFLQDAGFKRIEFSGFAPILNLTTETSIFYREQNCFNI